MNEERTPQSPPKILPVPEQENRPVWSVMIPAYNCIHYLEATIQSVCSQHITAMQIEVVDDCSTDGDVEALVKKVGKGKVQYYRQPFNRGSLRNFETCINRAKGKYVHILHGDDLVKPGFYQEIENLFNHYPQAAAAFTDFIYIDENGNELYAEDKKILTEPGIPQNWLHTIALGQRVQPPAMVVKREVYEKLGSFYAVHYGEDWEMWVRIAANYTVAHSPAYLALYRIHQQNITSRSFLSGQNIKDIDKVISMMETYLPAPDNIKLTTKARKNFSIYFARITDKIYHEYANPSAALIQAKAAFRLSKNPTTLYHLLKIQFKLFIRYKFKSMNYATFKP